MEIYKSNSNTKKQEKTRIKIFVFFIGRGMMMEIWNLVYDGDGYDDDGYYDSSYDNDWLIETE